MTALKARGDHGTTVLDLDYRPMFWASPDVARREVQRALGAVTGLVLVALGLRVATER